MTRLLLAAQSGWGKSFLAQHVAESNLPDYAAAVILDYKDEYRGLAEAGLASFLIGGPAERRAGREWWGDALAANDALVVARHPSLQPPEWRELAADAIQAARDHPRPTFVLVDEAHFVAPQRGGYPDPVKGLATTGRGERTSSAWVTQRLSELDKTVVTQASARLLGGFEGDEIDRVREAVSGYPADLHDPQARGVDAPEDLLAEDGTAPLRKFTDDQDRTIGSEWIYSTADGDRRRIDTRGLDLDSTHYSPQGETLDIP